MSQSQVIGDHHAPDTSQGARPLRPRPTPGAVREHLERLLASPRFATSPRCQLLLSYVVEETLKGNADSLKERNIGVEVFKRDPAYDTNADPIVRVGVGEIRKRLAQYYYEAGDQDQVRIDFPARSYAPVFTLHEAELSKSLPAGQPEEASADFDGPPDEPAEAAPPAAKARPRKKFVKILGLVVACALVAACAIILGWHFAVASSPFDAFWAPVLKSPNPVLICPGRYGYMYTDSGADPVEEPLSLTARGTKGVYSKKLPSTIILYDAVTLADIAGVLYTDKKQYSVRDSSQTNYDDLLKGPVVLVGAFNNKWTMHFIHSMRYQFSQNSDDFDWISDKADTNARYGTQVITGDNYGPQEYALVARVYEQEIRQPIIILAGVAPTGTKAAGEFVTNPQYMNEFLKTLPTGWQTKNLEILISTNVINNQPGAPHVVASSVW